MKLAHISDLHFTSFFNDSSLKKIKHLIKTIVNEKIDHLIITGDLTDNADEKDFEILRSLLRTNGLLDSDRLSVVVGNHDIFGGLQTPEDILSFRQKYENVDYDEKLSKFNEFFSESFSNCVYKSAESVYPYAKIIGDTLLIGMNSIAKFSGIKNPFASNGEIDLDQFTELVEIFNEYGRLCKNKIVMIHHHFNKLKADAKSIHADFWMRIEKQTMKLRKKKRLINLFKNNSVNLVLHGHYHKNEIYERGGVKFLNSGASIKNMKKKKLFFNTINTDNNKFSIEIRELTSNLLKPLSQKAQPEYENSLISKPD